jgi:thioredoxin-like negative regulator of GroEL
MSNQNGKPDSSTIETIERRLKDSTNKLHELAPLVGAARQVREFASDQRKNALAGEVTRYIQRGESVAAAESFGRSSPLYLERIKALEQSYKDAEATIAEWQATMATFEAARSLLAMSREVMKTLDG